MYLFNRHYFFYNRKSYFYPLLILYIFFLLSCGSIEKDGYKMYNYGSATLYDDKSPKGKLLRNAALGDAEAQFNLGTMYLLGEGFKQD